MLKGGDMTPLKSLGISSGSRVRVDIPPTVVGGKKEEDSSRRVRWIESSVDNDGASIRADHIREDLAESDIKVC